VQGLQGGGLNASHGSLDYSFCFGYSEYSVLEEGLVSLFKTRVTEYLGIEYPIIGAAMGYVSLSDFTAAVSDAGGLGLLPATTYASTEDLRQEIRKVRKLTDKPFGINIGLLARQPGRVEQEMEIAIEERVPVVETAARSPEPFIPYIERLKRAGIKVMHKCATVRHALSAEQYGAELVTIVGFEAGGRPSADEVTTMVLIPRAADLLRIPLIAGGGIGNARGFVAAMALGAEGVAIGTRFLATHECAVHPRLKELLIQSKETDTIIVQRSTRGPLRVLRNPHAQRVLEMENRSASLEELLPMYSGQRSKHACETGEGLDEALLGCGEAVGLINSVVSVKELIAEIVTGARAIYERLKTD